MLVKIQNLAHALLAVLTALVLAAEGTLQVLHDAHVNVSGASPIIATAAAAGLAISKAIDSASFTRLAAAAGAAGAAIGSFHQTAAPAPGTGGGMPAADAAAPGQSAADVVKAGPQG